MGRHGRDGDQMKILFFLLFLVVQILPGIPTGIHAENDSTIHLTLPNLNWAFYINLPGFEVREKMGTPNGKTTRFLAENPTTGIIVSVYLERTDRKGTSADCRNYFRMKTQKDPFKKTNISQYEFKNMTIETYQIPEYQGIPVQQKNLNAYLVEDNCWIDVHVSKVEYKPEDEVLFNAVLEAISIERNFQPSAYENCYFGNLYYEKGHYKMAIPLYEAALKQVKKNPGPDRNFFKILVDQLGMSYGISGDVAKAKTLFQWAISQEPEYPMFYYNLACAYAESHDVSGAIANLQQAFRFKSNMLPGETLPNPATDSSFTRFMSNRRFTEALKLLK